MRYANIVSAFVVLIFTNISSADARTFDIRPPEFRGGIEKQQNQNDLARRHAVGIIKTDADLRAEIAAGRLVPIEDTAWYYVDPDLGLGYPNRELLRYARPWVRDFIEVYGRDFYATFGKRAKITSLVRTQARHAQLRRREPNAARAVPTVHLTGAAIDVSKLGLTQQEVRWLRRKLVEMVASGRIVVIEEMYVLNFHVFVLPPPPQPLRLSFSKPRPNDYSCIRLRTRVAEWK